MTISVGNLGTELARSKEAYNRVLETAYRGIYLYGAGFVGRWSVSYFTALGMPILGIIDSDKRRCGQDFEGYTILNLETATIAPDSPVFISSRHAVRAILSKLNGLSNPKIGVDAFVVHHEYVPNLEFCEQLFKHDPISLETFRAILESMLIGHTERLTKYADATPFFGRYDFFNRDGEAFVDAGAYVGDSIERFIWSVNGVFREIHAFEPGPTQFNALNTRLARLNAEWALKAESVKLNNAALSDVDGYSVVESAEADIRTTIRQITNMRGAPTQKIVKTIKLDTYFSDRQFSLLKVDVEGAEGALLRGAVESIARYQPRIALSVYHYPTDLLRLVEQVRNINLDYQFVLGHHSSQLMDTVVYCRSRYG